jgi:hypothetical protein
MSEIYKYAAQNKLRFPSKKGELTVEQLFELPLTSQSGFDLNTIAKGINAQLKGVSEESFVEDTSTDPRKKALTVSLDIVKDVIATKQAENRAAVVRQEKAAQRKKLLDAIAAKKDANMSQASLDELERQLAAIDG